MEPAKHIKEIIFKALEKMDLHAPVFSVDHPTELSHGDYSTNVAMVLGKKMGVSPKDLAGTIMKALQPGDIVSRMEVAGPGFINFYLSNEFFEQATEKVLSLKDNFGKNDLHAGEKILVEHSSPNLFKPFHVGHVMNNAIGESITRFAEFSGAKVTKISYPSDVSLGIGKAVFALLKNGVDKLEALPDLSSKLKFLGECYVQGTKLYDESDEVQKQVRKITEIIYEKTSGIEYDTYQKGKDITLTYFKDITKRLGSEFDGFIYESEAGAVGEEIVRGKIGKVFKESDGAVIYEGEQDGLHTRVFINKEGYPTYEAKDIGLLNLKFERFNPDLSIVVTDHNQAEYYRVVLAAAGKIDKDWQAKTFHQTHGRMSFMGKKMSSRLGGIPTASDVLESVEEEVKAKLEDRNDQEKVDTITISALKFTILKTMAGKNINFDPETSLSFEGDSGPYLQYTNARINSVLEKAATAGIPGGSAKEKGRDIADVEKLLYRFSEVVEDSINDWSPHHVAGYLLELARAFNSWYGNTKIIDAENVNASYNVALAKAVSQTIQNGLYLLGIKAPERM